MTPVPEYAQSLSNEEINYLSNVRENKNYNITFLRGDKIIVLRNSDSKGNLIDLRKPAQQIPEKPWVMLSIRNFKIESFNVDVPVCENCKENVHNVII